MNYEKEIDYRVFLSALFLAGCEATTNPRTKTNTNQSKENASVKEKSSERHVKIKSENSFDETYANLKKAIESKEPLKIVAELDHSGNAKKAGLELSPTKIIMFGNPKLGTPLMKNNQAIGVDLPQKMLVYEDAEKNVFIVYNNPEVLAASHQIKGQKEITDKIAGALKGLAEVATKKK